MKQLNVSKTFLKFFVVVMIMYLISATRNKTFPNLEFVRSKFRSVFSCTPAKKIVFMKTHKCASSTIENILYRYALGHDWNLAMPLSGNYLSKTELFNHTSVTTTPWGKLDFHLFALHNRWNFPEVRELMGNDLKVFSIVRDPVNLFESLYGYMRLDLHYGVSIKDFIQLLKDSNHSKLTNSRSYDLFGRNQLSWDLGVPPESFDDQRVKMKEKIRSLDEELELVLVTERLEESLVLLRHLLCWPVEYLSHLVLNKREPSKIVSLDAENRKCLRSWLHADYMIYDHYVSILDERVKLFNAEHEALVTNTSMTPMEYEVLQLRKANAELMVKCVIGQVANTELSGKFRESSDDIMGYKIRENIEECHPYATSVEAFLELFRQKMNPPSA